MGEVGFQCFSKTKAAGVAEQAAQACKSRSNEFHDRFSRDI
jgi:hypothetical protein